MNLIRTRAVSNPLFVCIVPLVSYTKKFDFLPGKSVRRIRMKPFPPKVKYKQMKMY